MTSQVYYRKWRPSSFGDLVGQEHVVTTLRQAIRQGRIAHSYLFCGPRGTGKTTTARILAKAVNCPDSVGEGEPCNSCRICQTINDGRFLDIIELDAASNRGIDEIRAIREKVNFSPVEGRRKVYIIDEAHMLTPQASNAFLKTLEEPPAHVIFILCTTEAHNILPTIVSRCQRFDFRRLPADLVHRQLLKIVQAEGADVTPEALRVVARSAAGSLRDAENLLEQLVVSHGNGVGLRQVEELLGLGHGERWLELTKYLLMGNTAASLAVINQAAWEGTDLRQLHRQTLELLRVVMLLQWGSGESLDLPDHVAAELRGLVGKLPAWRVVKALKLWGEASMRYDTPSTLPLELAVVEICSNEVSSPSLAGPASPVPERVSGQASPRLPMANRAVAPSVNPPPAEGRPPPRERPRPGQAGRPQAAPPLPVDSPVASGRASPVPAVSDLQSRWAATVKALRNRRGKKYELGAVLRGCKADAIALEGDTLVLPFTHRNSMERMQEEMDDPQGRRLLTEAVGSCFGANYGLKLVLLGNNGEGSNATRPAQQSPLVRAALGMGGRIVEELET
jgi:DNA polymerase-3 subunit gamma/tau